jgi:NAD(P)H-quinone oxidoreductase subunit 5
MFGLFIVKATLKAVPEGRFARTLYPWLFAGLYLDERFTQLTFRLWPPRIEPRSTTSSSVRLREATEVGT